MRGSGLRSVGSQDYENVDTGGNRAGNDHPETEDICNRLRHPHVPGRGRQSSDRIVKGSRVADGFDDEALQFESLGEAGCDP